MNVFYRIICTSLFFTGFLCAQTDVHAQEINAPNRDISLKISNKRGRPVSKIIVHSVKTGEAGFTDRSGRFVFANMSDDDTISMKLPRYGDTHIPVAGMDSLVVTLRSSVQYSVNNSEGQSVVVGKNPLEMSTTLNVPEMLKKRSYSSLSQLLQGHVGMRGISSVNSSTEPLVVMDGKPVGTLGEADLLINVYDIKTIEIQKDGFEWGARGANGVIVVRTR